MALQTVIDPCWTVDVDPIDPGEFWHFTTRQDAEAYRVEHMHDRIRDLDPAGARLFGEAGVHLLTVQCLQLGCDHCGRAYTDPDSDTSPHLDHDDVHWILTHRSWTHDRSSYHCPDCPPLSWGPIPGQLSLDDALTGSTPTITRPTRASLR